MRRFIPVLVLAVVALSCRKEKKQVNPADVRLLRTESVTAGITHKRNFEYDASGRIIGVTHQENNKAPVPYLTITYNGNEVTLTGPVFGPAFIDETKLTLDAEKRVVKKTKYSYLEFGPPVTNPQRTYIYDTLVYEYDAAGLLKKATGNIYDSTWYNPGQPTIALTRSSVVVNYTNTNGNLATINKITTETGNSWQVGGPAPQGATTTREENVVFQYNRVYANATDFTNAAILNEIELFNLSPLNKKYANLPEKATISSVTRDQAGNTIFSSNDVTNVTLGYNSYGFLSSLLQASGTEPVRFIYNH